MSTYIIPFRDYISLSKTLPTPSSTLFPYTTLFRSALAHLYTEVPDGEPLISREDLAVAGLTSGPQAKEYRRRLGEYLRIGYTNGKQLYKRLKLFQITPDEFKKALEYIKNEDNY